MISKWIKPTSLGDWGFCQFQSDLYECDEDGIPSISEQGYCNFPDVQDESEYSCIIVNIPIPARIEVTKNWIGEHKEFKNPMYARARMDCSEELCRLNSTDIIKL